MNAWAVRGYRQDDERSWLRCRVLSFLDTCYFDDVVVAKPCYPDPVVELVAVTGADVVGLLDVVVTGGLATVETIAVHPDHRWRGIATGLLDHALTRLHDLGATEMDAWTREDQPALRWYAAHGFTEAEHYVHVHASREEVARAAQPASGFTIAGAFLHAPAASEQHFATSSSASTAAVASDDPSNPCSGLVVDVERAAPRARTSGDQPVMCAKCGGSWPCLAVECVVQDVRSGSSNN